MPGDPDRRVQSAGGINHSTIIRHSFDNHSSKLAAAVPDAEVLENGLAIRGNDAQNDQEGVRASVNEWLESLSY